MIKQNILAVFECAGVIFGVSLKDIVGPGRVQAVADARSIAVAFLLDNGIHRAPIMKLLGRDHTTLYVARRRTHECEFLKRRLDILAATMKEKGWSQ